MAWLLLRIALSSIMDVVAVCLLAALTILAMLGGSYPFEQYALWIGALGLLTCWLAPGAPRRLPIAMLAYAAVGLTSSAVHRWQIVSVSPDAAWASLFDPAFHLVTMVVFVGGAAHLLRTPVRLSLLAIGLVVSVSVLGSQILFDRARTDFLYERTGSSSLPLVFQWGSLHQTGMVMAVILPFPLALALTGRSITRVSAGLTMVAGLLVMGFVNGSRTGVLAMAVIGTVMALMSINSGIFRRWFQFRTLLLVALVGISAAIVFAVFTNRASMPQVRSQTGDRAPIWTAAAHIALEHPLLGVGPSAYSYAMDNLGYATRYLPWYPYNHGGVEQAHNMTLQAAAELGMFGAACLLATWWWMVAACWRTWRSGLLPILSFGFCGAIATFFIRAQADSFLDNLGTTDRTRILVWMLFAAAVALHRLRKAEAAG